MARKREFKAVYAGLFLLGLFLLYCAFTQYRWAVRLVARGEITTAKVVAVKFQEGYREYKGKRSKFKDYRPMYEFVTSQKAVHRFDHLIVSGRPLWRIGDEADIVYDPADPRRVEMVNYWGLFGTVIVLASLAAPLIVIGGGYFGYRAVMKGLPDGMDVNRVRETGKAKRIERQKPDVRAFGGA
jgi:hypothetical protein